MQTGKPGPAVPPPSTPGWGLTAGFLGAMTAAGMTVVLFVAALAVTYLVAREQHDDLPAVGRTVMSGTPTVDVLRATVLSSTLFGAFFCGGYVAARLSSRDGRRQGFLVWVWTLPVPLGMVTVAMSGDGLVRRVVSAAASGTSTTLLFGSLIALALLGALAGGDTGQRARAMPAAPDPAPAAAPDPARAWVDAAPVAAAVANPVR